MKSKQDFNSEAEYWEYVHTHATISATCVILSKEQWKDYSRIAKEASNVADAIVKVLSK